MKLDGKLLKKLILEVIEEGRQEKKWIAQQPEGEQKQLLSAEQQGLKLSDLAWIRNVRGGEPIQDIVGDVIDFRDEKTQQTLKSNNFETNLSKKTYPTVNDLRRTLQKISDANKLDVQYDDVLKDPSQVELLGKVGNWEILMPLTQGGSVACDISGKDTTWCTQKKSGQNLFYSYVGREDDEIILFYVMDYSRTPNLKGRDADARLSIGFLNGEPVLEGQDGGLSVDAENEGLIEGSLQNYLGDNYDKIMSILKTKAKKVGSKHPAKETLEKAAQNVILLKKLVKDYGKEEKKDFYKQILKQDEISPKVFYFLSKNNDFVVRYRVAENPSTPPEILTILARDKDRGMRWFVATNPSAPPEALAILARDKEIDVREKVANNPSAPPEALAILARDEDDHMRKIVATSTKTPPEILTILARDEDIDVREKVANNPSTPFEILTILAKDVETKVRSSVATNPSAPPEILAILAKDEEEFMRARVATNPSAPPEILAILAKDEGEFVRAVLATNRSTPPEILAILAKDEELLVRRQVALNPNTPKDALSERATSHLQESKRYQIKILK